MQKRLSGYLHFPITMRRYAQRACEKIVKFHGNWCNQRIDEKRIVFIQIPWNGNWNGNGRYLEAFFCHLLTPFTFKKILLNRRRNIVNDLEKKKLSLRMNYFQNFFPPSNELYTFH